jgi:quinol-cytochrome oxidoreductase complex cytochrome b subunit
VLVPGLAGVFLAWRWHSHKALPGGSRVPEDPAASDRWLIRWCALIFGLYLVLAPTIHPWYLTLVLLLLPFYWPTDDESGTMRRWIWPWIYFMFVEAITYLAYSGISTPAISDLELLQTIGYIPFWLLFIWAVLSEFSITLDFSHISIKNQ